MKRRILNDLAVTLYHNRGLSQDFNACTELCSCHMGTKPFLLELWKANEKRTEAG